MNRPTLRQAIVALLLAATARPCAAQDAATPKWFTPPPASARTAAPTVDMTHTADVEAITVIAHRASRSWRSTPATEHLNDPLASDAARPSASLVPPQSHCNSTLRTVGGQPGSASSMITGPGAGGC